MIITQNSRDLRLARAAIPVIDWEGLKSAFVPLRQGRGTVRIEDSPTLRRGAAPSLALEEGGTRWRATLGMLAILAVQFSMLWVAFEPV